MGYSVRTESWRYTVWLPFNNTYSTGDFTATPFAEELYDHSSDLGFDFDDNGEFKNLA